MWVVVCVAVLGVRRKEEKKEGKRNQGTKEGRKIEEGNMKEGR